MGILSVNLCTVLNILSYILDDTGKVKPSKTTNHWLPPVYFLNPSSELYKNYMVPGKHEYASRVVQYNCYLETDMIFLFDRVMKTNSDMTNTKKYINELITSSFRELAWKVDYRETK